MKQFLRWAQVQRRLTEHNQATGSPYGFFDAVHELWQEGLFQSAPALPSVSFLDWDDSDLDELEHLLDQVPVDLNSFYRDFEYGRTAKDSAEQINSLNIALCRTARHQTQGVHTHNAFEIDYVARGNAKLIYGDSSRTLPAGSLCLISPHFLHESVAGDDCILLSVMLSEQNIENTLFRLLQQESLVSDFFRFSLRNPHNGYILFHHLDPRAVLPVFYVGGEASILAELANQGPDIIERIGYVFKANDVIQEYSYNAGVNLWWGVNGQAVYKVTDKVAFKDSTLTVNLLKSSDGRYYTALASSSNQNHEVYTRNSWAAWDFLSQFSRNEDGSISIAPVTYSLASDDGKITDNSYNTGVATTFIDVPYGEYYDAAVAWASENGVTGGTGNNRFTPGNLCTRAQIVTFLWRAYDEPEPTITENPFTDLDPNEYYYKVVLWAYEKGITGGTGNGKFSPDTTCTRGQIVTFLYHQFGTQG